MLFNLSTDRFDIPVVLFTFRRLKAVDVMKRIAMVKPKKLYILSDNGRNEAEKEEVKKVRELLEKEITWDCEVIKNYAEENRGVYGNIGLGSKWVFEREEKAIFLEDDNLPELSFFYYAKELLEKYEHDTRVLWVCGTNYLGDYKPKEDVSYVFTRHMLPCGWASWSKKFNKFYDSELELADDLKNHKIASKNYYNKKLYKQYRRLWLRERNKILANERPVSWDFQIDFAIKLHGLYGIAPVKNQILNIGVDDYSIHGGNSFAIKQIELMCGMDSYNLEFPLKHPDIVAVDKEFEKEIYKILRFPLANRIKQSFLISPILKTIRKIFKIPSNVTTKEFFFKRKGKKQ